MTTSNIERVQLAELARDLVEIPSVTSDSASNHKVLDYLENYFKQQCSKKWKTKRICKKSSKHPMLYIGSRHVMDSFHSKILFLIHTDVVPGSKCKVMDEFGKDLQSETRNYKGKIYGRGVSDMKGPSAALLQVLSQLDPESVDIAMLCVTDEEIGGIDGAKHAFNHMTTVEDEYTKKVYGKNIDCEICHCPDGGDFFKLVTHEKGVLRFKLRNTGKAAHSAYPWLGVNAIKNLCTDLDLIQNTHYKKKSGSKAIKACVFNNGAGLWHTTMNISNINGGEYSAINVVPDYAEATVCCRFTEDHTKESLKVIIASAIENNSKTEFIFEQNMLDVKHETNKFFHSAEKVLIETLKRPKIEYSKGNGTSDAHWASFTTIMFKPDGGDLHQEGEWLDFDSLVQYYECIKNVVQEWATL